ncbi:MAG TPA: rhomboid family intramembrane serine protease [Syntrophomonadaceae bacterium]|nr:rhomboid family intramembrane serine protease [Syntrophomonadaceae bacterium]HNX28395.1 rhomboid family intramembrane serine protease [Syntrophomonadaceae bacterium]HPR92673.1 rhomboid family intramembrane serine protease [Syntrophomonadaceae bacterium]
MIPLRDSTPGQSFPLVTVTIIAINLVIFFYISQLNEAGAQQLFYTLGLVPGYYSEYETVLLDYLPFLSSMFLHGSWMHVISNMWILWLFGDNVEDHMGKLKFLLFYLLCGIIAALTHFIIYPYSNVPVVGASGAVAGIMGAYFIMFRHASVLTFIPPFFLFNIPAWVYLGFWIISQFWGGTVDLFITESSEQIAFWAHVGGFAAGALLYRFFLRPQPALPQNDD